MRSRWMAVLGLAALPAALLFSPAFGQDVPPELPGPEQHCGSITVEFDGEGQTVGGCIPPEDGGTFPPELPAPPV